jgi:hypothetical protein
MLSLEPVLTTAAMLTVARLASQAVYRHILLTLIGAFGITAVRLYWP